MPAHAQPGRSSGRPAGAQQIANPLAEEVEEAVARVAASLEVDMASLRARVRIALYCPPADSDRDLQVTVAEQAHALRKGRDAIAPLFIRSADGHRVNVRDCRLSQLSAATGCLISSAAHYLQSARSGGSHFGLEDPRSNLLVAYASVNTLDWNVLFDAMSAISEAGTEQLSLSRIYVSGVAPRNTISRLLALLVRHYSAAGRKAAISTSVDPNLGFRGTSYRASNWPELFCVPHLGYLYVDGQFCTRRQLIRTFGSDNPGKLADLLGPRFTMSGPLASDTLVFATATNRSLRLAFQDRKTRRLERK